MRNRLLTIGLLFVLDSSAVSFAADAPADKTTAADLIIADFEGQDFGDWKIEGDAFGKGPVRADKLTIQGYRGLRVANSFGTGDPADRVDHVAGV